MERYTRLRRAACTLGLTRSLSEAPDDHLSNPPRAAVVHFGSHYRYYSNHRFGTIRIKIKKDKKRRQSKDKW